VGVAADEADQRADAAAGADQDQRCAARLRAEVAMRLDEAADPRAGFEAVQVGRAEAAVAQAHADFQDAVVAVAGQRVTRRLRACWCLDRQQVAGLVLDRLAERREAQHHQRGVAGGGAGGVRSVGRCGRWARRCARVQGAEPFAEV
jgi:hypothetical protein